jgi:hypothetical protein
MATFDQETWQQETTWEGSLPTAASFWSMLQAETLPQSFHDAVVRLGGSYNLLKACFAQHLAQSGMEPVEIAERIKEASGTRPRERTILGLLEVSLKKREWNGRFSNLVSGTFTEQAFERAFSDQFESLGLRLLSETEKTTFVDYRVQEPTSDFALALNLKNAGVQYRLSMGWVDLKPEDTLPIATYKIFGSEIADIPPLVYVYLVDWTLLPRLRAAYWSALSKLEQDIFRLLACTAKIPRALEAAFIDCTVKERLDVLLEVVGYDSATLSQLPFRAISAARCRRIFYERHGRSPYVFRQRMNTDPNVHVSVAQETMAFSQFLATYLASAQARAALLQGLRRTTTLEIPDPPV